MKVTLEEEDIRNMITEKYPGAVIVGDTLKDIEVIIKVTELKIVKPVISTPVKPAANIIRDSHGNIDAKKSGLTPQPLPVTKPGGAMGRERNRLPVF